MDSILCPETLPLGLVGTVYSVLLSDDLSIDCSDLVKFLFNLIEFTYTLLSVFLYTRV